jgi:hypothetical protein
MSRGSTVARLFCLIVAAVVLHTTFASHLPSTAAAEPKRPNILWLVGENIDLDLGCYSQPLVRTPHLDRLAAEGLRFNRVFATGPVCATSRSAFMTGMYQTSTDTHHMRSHRDDDFRLPPGVRPLTHWLRDAGYFTANIKTIGDRTVGTGKLDLNFVNEGPIYQSNDWSALKSHQPFFAQINTPEVEYDIPASPASNGSASASIRRLPRPRTSRRRRTIPIIRWCGRNGLDISTPCRAWTAAWAGCWNGCARMGWRKTPW